MASIKSQKNPEKYFCEYCYYKSSNKKDYNKHLLTAKHTRLVNASNMLVDLSLKRFICNCGKSYTHDSSYYRHKKKCTYKNDDIVEEKDESKQQTSKNEINFDKEFVMMLIKQNAELMEIVKNGTMNNSNNTTTYTNSHNKAFNLNFFLNETCKNAMNITDFIDSIKLQLSDLMDVGELGYVDGLSKIIVKNLNSLDETIRPIHCTDKKRETMYVKDQGEWEKEDEKKTKLTKAVKSIANKNIRLLPQFREKYPEYNNSSSKISDTYEKTVIEAMTIDEEKNEKIIKNISKATLIQGK
jgi:hypothetical protein